MPRRAPSRRDQRPTGREVIAFIEKFLRIPDAPYAGQPLVLAPWQRKEIHRIYDGQVRRAIIFTAKKIGKTGLCAALLLNHLVGPSARNQRNARLFSSAMSRDQAALTFDAARKMILWNADLRQSIAIKESAKVRRNAELDIEYKALSSEAHRAQGLNPRSISLMSSAKWSARTRACSRPRIWSRSAVERTAEDFARSDFRV